MKSSNLMRSLLVGLAALALLALATTAKASEVSFEGSQTEGQTVSATVSAGSIENYTLFAAQIPDSTANLAVTGGTLVKAFGNATFPDSSNIYATANTCSGCTSTITLRSACWRAA